MSRKEHRDSLDRQDLIVQLLRLLKALNLLILLVVLYFNKTPSLVYLCSLKEVCRIGKI
jgi:hypothetical protein